MPNSRCQRHARCRHDPRRPGAPLPRPTQVTGRPTPAAAPALAAPAAATAPHLVRRQEPLPACVRICRHKAGPQANRNRRARPWPPPGRGTHAATARVAPRWPALAGTADDAGGIGRAGGDGRVAGGGLGRRGAGGGADDGRHRRTGRRRTGGRAAGGDRRGAQPGPARDANRDQRRRGALPADLAATGHLQRRDHPRGVRAGEPHDGDGGPRQGDHDQRRAASGGLRIDHGHQRGAGDRRHLAGDRHQPRHPRRRDAADRAQLLVGGADHSRRQLGRQSREHRPVDDHRLRLERQRERVLHRRRQHHRQRVRLPGQGAELRVHPGGRRQERRLRGGVRPRDRRHHQRDHQVGRQLVPRRRLRLLRQRFAAGHHAAGAVEQRHRRRLHQEGLRRRPWRLPDQGPHLVLRRLRPRRQHPEHGPAHGRPAIRPDRRFREHP